MNSHNASLLSRILATSLLTGGELMRNRRYATKWKSNRNEHERGYKYNPNPNFNICLYMDFGRLQVHDILVVLCREGAPEVGLEGFHRTVLHKRPNHAYAGYPSTSHRTIRSYHPDIPSFKLQLLVPQVPRLP